MKFANTFLSYLVNLIVQTLSMVNLKYGDCQIIFKNCKRKIRKIIFCKRIPWQKVCYPLALFLEPAI